MYTTDDEDPLLQSTSTARNALPSPGILEEKSADNTGGDSHATKNGHSHEPLFCYLVINQLPQICSLEVIGLPLDEQVVVAAGFCIGAELVVSEGKVVEALAAALGREAKYFREEAYAELLVITVV